MAPERTRTRPPRPPNSWLCFRNDYNSRCKAAASEENKGTSRPRESATQLSKSAAAIWAKATDEVKRYWTVVSDQKKIEHSLKYPDYKYTPRKKEDKEREKQLRREEKRLAKILNSNKESKPKAVRRAQKSREEGSDGNNSGFVSSFRAVENSVPELHSTDTPQFYQWHSSVADIYEPSLSATPPPSTPAAGSPLSLPLDSVLSCQNDDGYCPSFASASSKSHSTPSSPPSFYSSWSPSSFSSSLPDEQASPLSTPFSTTYRALESDGKVGPSAQTPFIYDDLFSQDSKATTQLTWEEAQVLASLTPSEEPYYDLDNALGLPNLRDSSLLQEALDIQYGLSTSPQGNIESEAQLEQDVPSPLCYQSLELSDAVPAPLPIASTLTATSQDLELLSSANLSLSDVPLSQQIPTSVPASIEKQEAHINEGVYYEESTHWGYYDDVEMSDDFLLDLPQDDYTFQMVERLIFSEGACMSGVFDFSSF